MEWLRFARYGVSAVMYVLRAALAALLLLTGAKTAGAQSDSPSAANPKALPQWIVRGLPGPGQRALQPLVGAWHVRLESYGALGRDPHLPPLVSNDLIARRTWVAGGRYIEDTTTGTMGGQKYWRRGWLGYSAMDRAYQWVTIDAINSMMMSYSSKTGSGVRNPIDLTGSFTDQGVAGEQYVGKRVAMRTVIHIESSDRHTIELFFTPPGQTERLATRQIYTRTGG